MSQRGFGLVYVTLVMSVLFAFCSLSVDFGRVQLSKSELQHAADAAARYAASGLSDNTYLAKAQNAAGANKCDGSAVLLLSTDVERGTWASGVFSSGGTSPNAVRVTAHRANARGTGVPLVFGRIIGMPTIDLTAHSIAMTTSPGEGYGIVGVDSINMSGNSIIDSYNSTQGSYAATHVAKAKVATNGGVNMNGNVKIYGDLYYRGNFSSNGNAGVVAPGGKHILSQNLSYANPTLPSSYTNMGNLNGSGNNSLTLTSGNYYFTNFSTSGNFTLNIVGQVNVYVAGNVGLSGNVNVAGASAANFRIYTTQSSGVNLSGNADLYADIYAPNSPINISGNGAFYGRIIGKSISLSGNGDIHCDTSLSNGETVTISTVR